MSSGARYFIDPFGCVKNQVDAENMMACLDSAGWSVSADASEADLIIVNSCGFIESAKRESINAVLGWRKLYPGKKILLAGCLAQRYAKELAESLPEADGFFGIDDITQITKKANNISQRRNYSRKSLRLPSERPLLSMPGSAYVKISEGCDNRCTFCAIPLIRGPLRCRTVPDIFNECKGLLKRGVKELCIIGQDICSYNSEGQRLPELLEAIEKLPGDFWVRLLYMHPDHFPLSILKLMKRDPRFLPYFDIPFQHASQRILAAMNRSGTADDYLSLADTIRKRLPSAVIRSTFLVGFPGETESDFSELLDFQEKLHPDWLGSFCYSREDGTPAYAIKGRVPKKTSVQRQLEIEKRQVPITEKSMDRFVNKCFNVLAEEYIPGEGAGRENFWLGRLFCHAPEIDGSAVIAVSGDNNISAGSFIPCRVIARRGFDLEVKIN